MKKFAWIVVLAVAIIFIVASFLLDHVESLPWVRDKIAPAYIHALNTYERMFPPPGQSGPGPEIMPNDPGFAPLASVISKWISGSGDLTIARLRIIGHSWAVSDTGRGMTSMQKIKLRVTLRDGRSKEIERGDLRPHIRKDLLEDTLFWWRVVTLLIGLVGAVLAAVIK